MTPIRMQALMPGFAVTLLAALMGLAIVLARAPYLHDFAEWLYQAQIVKQFVVEPASVSGFTLATYPVPNSLVTATLTVLSLAFEPILAGKVFLLLMLLAWAAVIRLFTARYVPATWRGTATLVLWPTLALSTFFWYGFASYQLALLFFTWFLSAYRGGTSAKTIALFSLAIFFSHAMVFLVFGLFLGIRYLLTRNRAILVGLLPATACSLWFLAGRYLANVEPQRIDAQWSSLREALIYKAGYPAMLGPFKNFLLPDGSGPLDKHAWLYWLGLTANFAVAAVLGVLLAAALLPFLKSDRSKDRDDPSLQTTCALSMLAIVVFYLIAPYHFFGLVNPGGRVLLPLLLLAFVLNADAVRRYVTLLSWPVALFSLLTVGTYLYLMIESRQAGFPAAATLATHQVAPAASVLDFNRRLYADARFRYFNYRVFNFSRRFEQIEDRRYEGLTFRHGMVIRYEAERP